MVVGGPATPGPGDRQEVTAPRTAPIAPARPRRYGQRVTERGPLDELFPGARAKREPLPDAPVHPRVLEVRDAPDVASFVVVVWPDAQDGPELRTRLAQVVEATLLAELSRAPSDLHGDGARRVGSLRLVSYAPIDPAAVARFGLQPVQADDSWQEALAHVRGEASAAGREPPENEPALFQAIFVEPSEALADLERALRSVGDEAIFGVTPGALARQVAKALGVDAVDLDGLGRALVPDALERMRWVEPMLFQALCDGAGVHAARALKLPVQWAVSEPDEDGMAPPPLLRTRSTAGDVHVPVGLELLRWCVMPLREGESVPPLSAWCKDRFAGGR